MNAFTKDELQMIIDDINNDAILHRFGNEELYKKLKNKAQYMIDNYCDHESVENIGGFRWRCIKCGKKIGDE